MICQNKSEFIEKLTAELSKNNIGGQQDILQDFEQHFSDGAAAGETEQQVCEKLGDPSEIAKQYINDADNAPAVAEDNAAAPAPETAGDTAAAPEASGFTTALPEKKGFSPDAGSIIGLIVLDLLVFSWALPALASVIASFYVLTTSVAVGGIGVIVGGVVMNFGDISAWFVSCFSPISTVLLGAFMVSLGVLMVMLSIKMTIGFINIIIKIINWHGRKFAGKNVCSLIGKKYRRESVSA